MKSRWPDGALTKGPIKRDIPNDCALAFARRGFEEAMGEAEWSTIAHLRRWFEDNWDGGGVTLETWDEAAVVVMLLFREDADEN